MGVISTQFSILYFWKMKNAIENFHIKLKIKIHYLDFMATALFVSILWSAFVFGWEFL